MITNTYTIDGLCAGHNFSGNITFTNTRISGVIRPFGRLYGSVQQRDRKTGLIFVTMPIFLPDTAHFFMAMRDGYTPLGEYEAFVESMQIDEPEKRRIMHLYEASSLEHLTALFDRAKTASFTLTSGESIF